MDLATNVGRRNRPLLLPVAWIALAAPVIFAQATAGPQLAPAPTQTARPAQPLAFDVVSIKQNKSDGGGGLGRSTPDGDVNINSLLAYQIGPAYGVEPDNIYGLPDWAKNNRYDIQTKVAAEDIEAYRKLHRSEHRRMMQAVFEDRLKLKAHLVSKEVPMYQLVIAKGGPKLHEAKPGDTYADGIKAPDGTPIGAAGARMGRGSYTGQQITVSALLNWLKGATGRPVVDKTGLTGKYDITLRWTPDLGPSTPDSAPPDETLPTIFGALEDQLGLKLEPTKGTIPTLIIDHIEPPTEN
jgi:uncharacterized protein (TIGR03435 family)